MEFVTALGSAGGTLATSEFWPPLCRRWKTRSPDDLSIGMVLTFTTGVFLWLLYGMYLHALPIIVANAVTLI